MHTRLTESSIDGLVPAGNRTRDEPSESYGRSRLPARGSERHQLRIAVVGAGPMAHHHARAIQELGGRASLEAVVDPDADARSDFLRSCPDVAEYESVDALLEAGTIDVVHVCSPPQTHADVARAVLQAGCHAYVEKPFTETRAAAEELVAIADERGLRLCAGHQLLFEPPARRALELTEALGDIVHVESYFAFRPVRRARGGGPAMRTEQQLLDVLPHPTYLLLAFLRRAAPEGNATVEALETGRAGTVQALLRRDDLTGSLVVTLSGRPVESYVRIVGTNGTIHADFVRGTVQRLIGPGSSGIDKALNPFRVARQLGTDTAVSLGKRILNRQRSYPGLREIFTAFYDSIDRGAPSPLTGSDIVETVDVCERVARALPDDPVSGVRAPATAAPTVVVTGGTGFLGAALSRALTDRGLSVRAVARRTPPAWERASGVQYIEADLGSGLDPAALSGCGAVIHCAAETAGGWSEHQRNSLDATENLIRAAAAAGVEDVIHVSSLAVLSGGPGKPVSEQTPVVADGRSRGPYVWGKLESEKLALRLGEELGVRVRVARPGALVDYHAFDPPGRLGRRLGNVFVAVGSGRDRLGVTSVDLCAETLAWMSVHADEAPAVVNLLDPEPPTKRDLIHRLRARNPDLRVVWLPRLLLTPLSLLGLGLQKVIRPRRPAINVARVFARESYDTSGSSALVSRAAADAGGGPRPASIETR